MVEVCWKKPTGSRPATEICQDVTRGTIDAFKAGACPD